MTVAELITTLRKCNPNAEALIWDPETESWQTVTGIVYNAATVELHSDENDHALPYLDEDKFGSWSTR